VPTNTVRGAASSLDVQRPREFHVGLTPRLFACCDVFYLFWSTQAKDSKWVMQEIEYALARSAASPNGEPDIIPVIIEGPPPPTPPETLKDIHFNDSLIYVLAGLDGARPAR
jgi:hypothetical protein